MSERKVYLLVEVEVPFNLVGEFNEYWQRESLPVWTEHGARHVVSLSNYVGGPVNEIVRLFEFDSVSQWENWQKFLAETERGQNLLKGLSRFITTLRRRLLLSVY